MAQVRSYLRSFNGGEVAPAMFARIDDGKYQTGLALCRNFLIEPQGPVQMRPGFAYVNEVKDSDHAPALIEFSFSSDQTMVLEVGGGYVRFHTHGQTLLNEEGTAPYEVETDYAADEVFDIHYVQSADVLTFVHPNHPPRELRRYGATDWRLVDINFASSLQPPAKPSVKQTISESTSNPTDYVRRYAVTSLKSDGTEESAISEATQISCNPYGDGAYNTISWTAVPGADRYRVYRDVGGIWSFIGETDTTEIIDENIDADSSITPPIYDVPFSKGDSIQEVKVLTEGSGYKEGDNLTVTDETGSGAELTAVIEDGSIKSVVVKKAGSGYSAPSISVESSAGSGATFEVTIREEPDFPGAVSYFEQRRWFGGTINKPNNLWATKSGTESDMSYSLPTQDDDRISVRVAAREANRIRHIVPLSQLMLLTGAAEWRVSPLNSDAITPASMSVRPQSYVGANNVQPLVINSSMIYAQERGGHLRECGYNYQAGGYISADVCLRAPHLFDNYEVKDLAYSKAPWPTVWAVSSSGKLIAFTYVPEQQVGAFSTVETDGVFEACCVVAEGDEDALYCVVKRTIEGETKRFVERMHERQYTALENCFYVDCGGTYEGDPTTEISGLDWLEGCEVAILADGSVEPHQVVKDGKITLSIASSKVHVGLPYTGELRTLPMALALQDGSYGSGHQKNVREVYFRVVDSSGLKAGPSLDRLAEYPARSTEFAGSPPDPITDEFGFPIYPLWGPSGQVYVRQENPLPLRIISMTTSLELV